MSYNGLSKTAGAPHGPTLNGLVLSGADFLKSMYDIRIWFPDPSTGAPSDDSKDLAYPLTVRATGFTVPEVSVGTYDIKYHGVSVKRPNGQLEGDRVFDITFREDAAFELRMRFTAWMMAVGDPVTGGVSNSVNWFGTVEVSALRNEFTAASLIHPTGKETGSADGDGILNARGEIYKGTTINPLLKWSFYHVWVYKVGGVEFQTDGSDANQFVVSFAYQDCDFPFFGGNEPSADGSM